MNDFTDGLAIARSIPELETPGFDDKWQALTDLILAYGGDRVVRPYRPWDVQRLIDTGEIQHPSRVKLLRGQQSDCHSNAARVFLGFKWAKANPTGVAKGYALTADDGLWREHSWVLSGSAIIETTVPREAYWGVTFHGMFAFAMAALQLNISPHDLPGMLSPAAKERLLHAIDHKED